jgi:hypothetical protein
LERIWKEAVVAYLLGRIKRNHEERKFHAELDVLE